MIAVVALAVATVLAGTITWQCLAGRRVLDCRQHQLQAEWLARAGVELAAARLLADPTGYTGEAVELIPGSQVRIAIRAEQGAPNVFRVTSEARYSKDGTSPVMRSVTRSLRRMGQGKEARIEIVAETRPVPKGGDSLPKP